MKRMLPIVFALAVVLVCGTRVALAEPDPQGTPKGMEAGKTLRWYVWHDAEGWHVRTTTHEQEHHFTGTIRAVGGKILDVHASSLERKGKEKDSWEVREKDTEIKLDFKTDKHMDGFDFHVGPGADSLKFKLEIDGKDEPERIFIGAEAANPKSAAFTLPAHPKKK